MNPSFQAGKSDRPLPRASFLIPPLGPGCACGSRRRKPWQRRRSPGGFAASSRPCPLRRGQPCKDPRGVNTSLNKLGGFAFDPSNSNGCSCTCKQLGSSKTCLRSLPLENTLRRDVFFWGKNVDLHPDLDAGACCFPLYNVELFGCSIFPPNQTRELSIEDIGACSSDPVVPEKKLFWTVGAHERSSRSCTHTGS